MPAFDDVNDDGGDAPIKGPVRKIGLKQPASSKSASSLEQKAAFEQKANEVFENTETYKQQIWDLSIKYKSFIESKVLPENRGPINLSLEKEVIDKLVALATRMNEDETQEVGIGSTALCMLLMKCMLLQRDYINVLSYKLMQLENKQPK